MCIALHSTFHSKDKMHGNCNDFGKQHGWVESTFAIDKFWLNQFSNSLFRRWFFLDQQTQTEMNCKQNVREKRRRERSEQWLFAFVDVIIIHFTKTFLCSKQLVVLLFTRIVRSFTDCNSTEKIGHAKSHTKTIWIENVSLTCVSVSVLSAWYFNKSFNETDVCTISANIGIKGNIIICHMKCMDHEIKQQMISISVTYVRYFTRNKCEIQLKCAKNNRWCWLKCQVIVCAQWTMNLQFLEISDCNSNILELNASKSRFAVTKLSKAQRMMMKSSSRCSSYGQMKSDYDGDIDRFSSKEWLLKFFPTWIRIHSSYNRNECRHDFELLTKIDKLPLRKKWFERIEKL